jgi:hypothetical protein
MIPVGVIKHVPACPVEYALKHSVGAVTGAHVLEEL